MMIDSVAVVLAVVVLLAINTLFYRWGYARGFTDACKEGTAQLKPVKKDLEKIKAALRRGIGGPND